MAYVAKAEKSIKNAFMNFKLTVQKWSLNDPSCFKIPQAVLLSKQRKKKTTKNTAWLLRLFLKNDNVLLTV